MEENTAVLSLKRYEELTTIERELKNKKMVVIKKQIYIPSTLWYTSEPSTFNDSIEFYFLTESDAIKILSEEIDKLKEMVLEKDSVIRQVIRQKNRMIDLLRPIRSRKVKRIIEGIQKNDKNI